MERAVLEEVNRSRTHVGEVGISADEGTPKVERDVYRDDNIEDVPWFSTVTKSAVPMQCLHSR